MAVEPRTDEAIIFLKRWSGPWTLTAIAPNQQGLTTASFEDVKEMKTWIEKHNGKRNLYFNVNPTIKLMNKKALESDLASMNWLHVDVDPRAGEDFGEERERLLQLTENLPQGLPQPTVIIDSGGGYQLFWELKDPVPLNGEITKIEKMKLYNKQLEIILGGDHCFNLDRIMRLPGTVNLPNKKKREKGRVKAQASLIRFGDETYNLSMFKSAPSKEETINEPQYTVLNAVRVKDMDEIDAASKSPIPDWCKVIIVQGNDPDNPNKFDSRSQWLFLACCEMVRHGVPDDMIFGIITDPDLGISESVLDKKSKAEEYAQRQIRRAHEEAINPILRELNEKHAVISDIGGRCRVISEIFDPSLNRNRISRQTFDDFRNRYSNRYVEVGDKEVTAGKYWLAHPMRRQYETIVFAPGRDINGSYNLWQGFAVEPEQGDWSIYEDHLRRNLCGGNDNYFQYLIQWMARAVQQPDSPGEVAIVMRGAQGTGKSIAAKIFGSLFGRHFVPVSDSKHIVGNFNAHLRDCVVLFGDEAFYAGDVRHESILKMLITEEVMVTEVKGLDAEVTPNYTHILLASNKTWVIPAGAHERRFFLLDVGEENKQDKKFFRSLRTQMDHGGNSALLFDLMKMDITDFDVRTAPITAALHEQRLLSLRSESEWWLNKLTDGKLLRYHEDWTEEVAKDSLLEDYLDYAKSIGIQRRSSATSLGKFLNRVCPDTFPRKIQKRFTSTVDGKSMSSRPHFYVFPSLDKCREYYAKTELGGRHEWPEDTVNAGEQEEI